MKKIHFIGIGGIGISALAKFMAKKNYIITGSDITSSHTTKELEKLGCKIYIPHASSNISDQDLVIHSACIKEDNVEILKAKSKNIPILSRKQALPMILEDKKVFSVAGAHGKSTTSAMLASIIDGSVIIGAVSKQYASNMFFRESENIIFEADESDSSFIDSNPYIAIVTNAEPEHMEHYDYDLKKFHAAYLAFLQKATYRVINAEDEFLVSVDFPCDRLYPSKDISELKSVLKNGEVFTSFRLKDLGIFEVYGIGLHIAIDASLAILAGLHELPLEEVRQKIKNFKGIKKRFDIIENTPNFTLVDDYAHHPTEIRATLKSAQEYAKLKNLKQIHVIWQPHKYSRLLDNLEEFKACFDGICSLNILPVYSAGQENNGIDMQKEFAHLNPTWAKTLRKNASSIIITTYENEQITLDEGLVIGFGAGDITLLLRGLK